MAGSIPAASYYNAGGSSGAALLHRLQKQPEQGLLLIKKAAPVSGPASISATLASLATRGGLGLAMESPQDFLGDLASSGYRAPFQLAMDRSGPYSSHLSQHSAAIASRDYIRVPLIAVLVPKHT